MDVASVAGAVALGVACLVLFWISEYQRKRKMPPGPMGLPIVGYIPFIPLDYGDKLMELRQKYGRIFSLTLGSRDLVVVSDFDVLKKVMNQDIFNYRPDFSVISYFIPNSLAKWSGDEWRYQRKFVLKVFRHLGLGKDKMEANMLTEIREMMQQLATLAQESKERKGVDGGGGVVNISRTITSSVSNIACLHVTGKRYDYNSPVRQMLDDCFVPRGEGVRPSLFGYFAFMPFVIKSLSYMTFNRSVADFEHRMGRLMAHVRQRVAYFRDHPEETENSCDCFIEAYMKAIRDPGTDKGHEYFDEKHLMGCAVTLFFAGVDATTELLFWFFQLMMLHPKVQQKMRQEIDAVIGDNIISTKYRNLMPYTEAVMQETHRVGTSTPSGINHAVAEDCVMAGYKIPKGTQVQLSAYLAHRDPEYFEDPEVYRPERFIAKDGSFIRDERMIAFGVGRRACPGEPIAHNEVFLYLTSLVQRFEILPPPGTNYTLKGVMDFAGRIPENEMNVLLRERQRQPVAV